MKINTNKEKVILVRDQLATALAATPELSELQDYLNLLREFEPLEVDENYMKLQVFSILAFHSGFDIKEIKENQNLKFELGITSMQEKWLMVKKFNSLIRELGGKKLFTREESDKLEFVSDCLKAVKSKLP